MMHILRGYQFAKALIDNNFNLDLSYMKPMKQHVDIKEFEIGLPAFREQIKRLRQDVLNPMFERKEIPRFLDPKIQFEISNHIVNSIVCNNTYELKKSLLDKIFYYNENTEFKYD